jgi:hypothetical protein
MTDRAPVSGTCARCGCELGYVATKCRDVWYCCGACAGSDRCGCGCKPEFASEHLPDVYVPTRRMFASREADGLKRPSHHRDEQRAFPFADRRRGR